MHKLFIYIIRAYQIVLSPVFGQHCRFTPSCSNYAIEALQKHGILRGSWLATKRLFSCHPWHEGGYDPVPEHKHDGKHKH